MGNDTHRWGPKPPVTFACHLPALPQSIATEVPVLQDELLQLGGKDASSAISPGNSFSKGFGDTDENKLGR